MDLSVIIPCYEEHECLPLLFDRITEALGTTGLSYELVFVNVTKPGSSSTSLLALGARRASWE